ncbi:MAG: hypothetical protein JOZ33_03785 [Acidobacteriaceae bacterium]|nr:hypothetical protein [Acidobacteriaceae bacterium]
MEFDPAKLDTPIGQENLADHWRERAECLEEWVCELLRKNQTLRMALEKEQPQRLHREDSAASRSFLSLFHSIFPSDRPASRTEAPEIAFGSGSEPCPRQECVDIRESVKRLMMRWGIY